MFLKSYSESPFHGDVKIYWNKKFHAEVMQKLNAEIDAKFITQKEQEQEDKLENYTRYNIIDDDLLFSI